MRPWTIHTGDCRLALAAMEPDSIDGAVVDTPYGLSNLLDPPNLDREALWQKLTAGQAELPIKRLMRSWLDTGENPVMKGSGFMGHEWDALVPPPNTWSALWRVMKPGAYLLAFGGTRTYDLITMSIRFAAFDVDDQIATWLQGQGMVKRVRLGLKIDEHYEEAETRRLRRAEAKRSKKSIPPASHPDSARFAGHDRQLGPKWEPIIVAAKPLCGTIAETALRYGTGGLNVDACRIPRGDVADIVAPRSNPSNRTRGDTIVPDDGDHDSYAAAQAASIERLKTMGGYPANVIIDEATARELDAQSGIRTSNARSAMADDSGNDIYGKGLGRGNLPGLAGSEGGASRFFYTAKASTAERDKGLEESNLEPCVKPIDLMRYLVRLASPPGAHDPDESKRPTIIDIFAGSGSTLVAGLMEGVRVIGCELRPEAAEVARRRCHHAYTLPLEDEAALPAAKGPGQVPLF